MKGEKDQGLNGSSTNGGTTGSPTDNTALGTNSEDATEGSGIQNEFRTPNPTTISDLRNVLGNTTGLVDRGRVTIEEVRRNLQQMRDRITSNGNGRSAQDPFGPFQLPAAGSVQIPAGRRSTNTFQEGLQGPFEFAPVGTYQAITVQPEYQNKSFEELRYSHLQNGTVTHGRNDQSHFTTFIRRPMTAPAPMTSSVSSTSGFGSSPPVQNGRSPVTQASNGSPFGTSTSSPFAQSIGGFGDTSGLFGSPSQKATKGKPSVNKVSSVFGREFGSRPSTPVPLTFTQSSGGSGTTGRSFGTPNETTGFPSTTPSFPVFGGPVIGEPNSPGFPLFGAGPSGSSPGPSSNPSFSFGSPVQNQASNPPTTSLFSNSVTGAPNNGSSFSFGSNGASNAPANTSPSFSFGFPAQSHVPTTFLGSPTVGTVGGTRGDMIPPSTTRPVFGFNVSAGGPTPTSPQIQELSGQVAALRQEVENLRQYVVLLSQGSASQPNN